MVDAADMEGVSDTPIGHAFIVIVIDRKITAGSASTRIPWCGAERRELILQLLPSVGAVEFHSLAQMFGNDNLERVVPGIRGCLIKRYIGPIGIGAGWR